jgi:hypothetical protein
MTRTDSSRNSHADGRDSDPSDCSPAPDLTLRDVSQQSSTCLSWFTRMQQECLSVSATKRRIVGEIWRFRVCGVDYILQRAGSYSFCIENAQAEQRPAGAGALRMHPGGRYGRTDGQITDQLAISGGDQITVVFGRHGRGVDEGNISANQRPSRGDRRSDFSSRSASGRGVRRRAASGLAERYFPHTQGSSVSGPT